VYSESRLSHGAALWRSSGAGGAVIPADGCVDLILRDGRVWVAGPSTRWIASESDGVSGSFGLRLPPGRAHHVLGPSLSEVVDQLVPLDDVTHRESAQQVREAILPFGDAPRPTAAVAALIDRAETKSLWSATVHRWAMDAAPAKHVAASFGESE
jgi:hypothetical protein